MNATTLRTRLRKMGCSDPEVYRLLIATGRLGSTLVQCSARHFDPASGHAWTSDHTAKVCWALRNLGLGHIVSGSVVTLDPRSWSLLRRIGLDGARAQREALMRPEGKESTKNNLSRRQWREATR